VLVAITYNYLAIPTASVGVKYLFNITRDICSYYRYYLKPATIRALVIIIYINRFLLLEELDNIKVTKEIEEVRLPKEPEDQEIFEIKDLEGLISDKEDSNEDFNFNSDRMAHRAINKDGEENNKDKKPKDFTLPVLRYAGPS
jgi:hypothetical protein